jgi:hypothetical protein
MDESLTDRLLYYLGVSAFAMIEILGSVQLWLGVFNYQIISEPVIDQFLVCSGVLACLFTLAFLGEKAVERYFNNLNYR